MLLLVSGATQETQKHPECGILVTPRNGNAIDTIVRSAKPWAADNDAFAAWDADRFWSMLTRIARADRSRFLWVACPDVVGDAQATVNRWFEWYPQIEALGLPTAFVAQDGLEDIADQTPWSDMAAIFIGGTTAWKLGESAQRFCREAKARRKLVHVGRVNSRTRVQYALEIGADSVDGSGFSRWPKLIPKGLRWANPTHVQRRLL